MKLKLLTRLFTMLLALNFCGQVVYHATPTEIVQEIDFDQDSEKEESKNEKEQDQLSQHPSTDQLESQLTSALRSTHCLGWWKSPSIEVSDPPPEVA